MRSNPSEYEMLAPPSLHAIVSLLAHEPGSWLPIAGGTDIMVQYAAGKLPTRKLVSIWNIPELRRIEVAHRELRIGAASTYTDLRHHEIVASEFPCCQLPRAGPAASRTRIEVQSAATSSTHPRQPTPCPRCWLTKPN